MHVPRTGIVDRETCYRDDLNNMIQTQNT